MSAAPGHVIVGAAVLLAGAPSEMRLRPVHWATASALSLGADFMLLAMIGLGFSSAPARGLSHSFLMAGACTLFVWSIVGLAGYKAGGRIVALWFAVWGSHLLIDTASASLSGAQGLMLLWPLWDGRLYLGDWLPLYIVETDNMAAVIRSIFSPVYVTTAAREALLLSPVLIAAALLRRRPRGARPNTSRGMFL